MTYVGAQPQAGRVLRRDRTSSDLSDDMLPVKEYINSLGVLPTEENWKTKFVYSGIEKEI